MTPATPQGLVNRDQRLLQGQKARQRCNARTCHARIRQQAATQIIPDPKVLRYFEFGDRSFLFVCRVSGRTLMDAWVSLSAEWRRYYIGAIVQVCKEAAAWKGDALAGVDGQCIPERYLTKIGGVKDFSPESLQRICRGLGMDCANYVFYHADLGPGNIIVEDVPKLGTIGIIDWEVAGFFPWGWIRTKFRLCSGMDFEPEVTDHPDVADETCCWRREVQRLLGAHGLEDFSGEWMDWWW
ncbi:hypothetical protein AJ79_03408 [Helicocarpus griseus UAMH5409]|uniref:Aminoglycoside phosphotransferase domain-containing protein n=1 Tax=Helicocarpus griseus UAMH5409 TaxID=1447875 RepID=A0A2B7XXT3_9EURO|nr:hypothetical protein AJ79_03408 [Helicocarpus griseus UAMH5409]